MKKILLVFVAVAWWAVASTPKKGNKHLEFVRVIGGQRNVDWHLKNRKGDQMKSQTIFSFFLIGKPTPESANVQVLPEK